MSSGTHYDAVVIGSGQGGTPLAMAFAQAKMKTALIESTHIGGCCVNEGCTPTKTMVASGRVAYLTKRGGDYGVNTGNITVSMEKVRQRKRDIVDSFRSGSERRVRDAGVEVITGSAQFEDDKMLKVKVNGGAEEKTITADRIFVCTGERPATPKLAHEFDASAFPPGTILDSTSVQELGVVPSHLVVVGGGYIGLEFGQLFRRLGADVTVLQRGSQLLPREDADVAEAILNVLKEDGVKVLLKTSPTKIEATGYKSAAVSVSLSGADGSSGTLNASHVLFAAGRVPNTDTLNLEAAGIKATQRGHIVVNEQLVTTNPRVWALGDVKGPPAFTHVSYDDFRLLRANLLEQDTRPSPLTTVDRILPYVVYTDPQLGHVGLHEHEARAKFPNAKIQVASMPMAYVARALETDESRGLMKAVIDADSQKILGFTCLGLEGGEIMSVVQMAMIAGSPWTALRDAVWAHPSLAESLNNLWGMLK